MAFRFPLRRARGASSKVEARFYAIGDIHGRIDLLSEMIDKISDDVLTYPSSRNVIVILGDFIDRGPKSAELIALFMGLRKERNIIVLKGNHEASMVDALAGDHAALDLWLAHGGLATLESFGIELDSLDPADTYRVLRLAREAVSPDVRKWMTGLPTHFSEGAYHFVHAGIRPGVPLDLQSDLDRLWIGEDFTQSTDDHGAIVVHGHTISEAGVDIRSNRIGVDTGAYRTNRLSAVVLERQHVRTIVTEAA